MRAESISLLLTARRPTLQKESGAGERYNVGKFFKNLI